MWTKAETTYRFMNYREMSDEQVEDEINRIVVHERQYTRRIDSAWGLVAGLMVIIDNTRPDSIKITLQSTPELVVYVPKAKLARGLCVLWLLWLVINIDREKVVEFVSSSNWV